MEKKDNIVAYSGKIVKYKNKELVLRPEESLRGCFRLCIYSYFRLSI